MSSWAWPVTPPCSSARQSQLGGPPHGSTWSGGPLLQLGAGIDVSFEAFALFGEARWYAEKADWNGLAAQIRTLAIGVRF